MPDWSISDWKGNTRNYIPVSSNDLLFINSFTFFFLLFGLLLFRLQSYEMHTKSVYFVFWLKSTENTTKRNPKQCCVFAVAVGVSLISARKLIEFRKVDDFWAICCGPSNIRNCNINCTPSPILNGQLELSGFVRLMQLLFVSVLPEQKESSTRSWVQRRCVSLPKRKKSSAPFWRIEMEFKLMWNALRYC